MVAVISSAGWEGVVGNLEKELFAGGIVEAFLEEKGVPGDGVGRHHRKWGQGMGEVGEGSNAAAALCVRCFIGLLLLLQPVLLCLELVEKIFSGGENFLRERGGEG